MQKFTSPVHFYGNQKVSDVCNSVPQQWDLKQNIIYSFRNALIEERSFFVHALRSRKITVGKKFFHLL